jgi:transposase-like protein
MADLAASSWVAVGAKYGVSDNAVRKWVRRYERDAESARAA